MCLSADIQKPNKYMVYMLFTVHRYHWFIEYVYFFYSIIRSHFVWWLCRWSLQIIGPINHHFTADLADLDGRLAGNTLDTPWRRDTLFTCRKPARLSVFSSQQAAQRGMKTPEILSKIIVLTCDQLDHNNNKRTNIMFRTGILQKDFSMWTEVCFWW